MEKSVKKRVFWISIIILILSVGTIIYIDTLPGTDAVDNFQILSAILISMALIDLIVLFFLKYHDRRWLKRITLYSTLIVLPLSFPVYIVFNNSYLPIYLEIIMVVFMFILCLLSLIYIFIIRAPDELRGMLTLLILIVICVVLTRLKVNFSIVEDLLLPGFITLTAGGIYMLGLRSLFVVEKNGYLKIISFIACTLTAFGCFLIMLKMQGNDFSIMELVYFIPAFLLTLIVLLSLPVSGYVTWISLQKRILKKIAIAWIFFLIIFSIRYIYPDLFTSIVFREKPEPPEFWLEDYNIPNNNGLEIQ
ncbi:MAG: hypothetical protein NT092_07665 [Bacteroidia bacterium]|nr:hypothetical protein [Bacteroidia bacterium]